MATWHQDMASYEDKIRGLEAQVQDLQSGNESLQKEIADFADALAAHQYQSRNSAHEFERQIEAANKEWDLVRTLQKEADDEAGRSANRLKKAFDA